MTDAWKLIESVFCDHELDYTGNELRSHFIREVAGIAGDGIIAFMGRCDVSGKRLVDLEDAEKGSSIRARRMLHFVGEHFRCSLGEGNVLLRLLASIVKETIEDMDCTLRVRRSGDDLFVHDRKLSVAICTVSPVSLVFHFGINIDPAGAPVATSGLEELGIEPRACGLSVLERYCRECESIEFALRKVRGVP